MATYKTIKRFAWTKKKLTDGKIIRWGFYYEDREYDRYVDLDKYNAYKNGDSCYEFPANIYTGSFLFDGYKVIKTYCL